MLNRLSNTDERAACASHDIRGAHVVTLWAFALVSVLGATSQAWPRDLQGRLGLGYNAEWANTAESGGVPGISVKYAFTHDIAFEGILGVSTSSPSNSVTAAKIFKNLFYETNLNFYFQAGGGVVSALGNSGAQLMAGFGAEYFIPGIESLGFSMETGATMENVTHSKFVLKSMGVSFLNAGMHFYF